MDNLLSGQTQVDHVISLTDVYTGSQPPDFKDALDAKAKMRQWVGAESRFYPHAAQYDFEAWLLPYWQTIQRLAGHNRQRPPGEPETVNYPGFGDEIFPGPWRPLCFHHQPHPAFFL